MNCCCESISINGANVVHSDYVFVVCEGFVNPAYAENNCSLLATFVHLSAIIEKKPLLTMLVLIYWTILSDMICKHSFWMSLDVYLSVFFSIQVITAELSRARKCSNWMKLLLAPSLCPLSGKPCRARKLMFWRIVPNIALFSAFCHSCSMLNLSPTSPVCFEGSLALPLPHGNGFPIVSWIP